MKIIVFFIKKKPDILFQPEKSRTFAAIFY